ncbi:hypothetical protein LEMLEM_LOCUS18025 [Lemmus lemmus]
MDSPTEMTPRNTFSYTILP